MRGEYLFDKGGTGPRQSDDENRVWRRITEAFAGREKCLGEQGVAAMDMVRGFFGIIPNALSAKRIAGGVVLERVSIFRLIFESFTEREVDVISVLV